MNKKQLTRVLLAAAVLVLMLAGCMESASPAPTQGANPPVAEPSTPTLTPSPEPSATPAPTATPLAPLAILLALPGSDGGLSDLLQAELALQAPAAGLRWQIRQTLSPVEAAEARYIVVLAAPKTTAAEIDGLVSGAPGTNFLVAGLAGVAPAPNLVSIAGGNAPDQTGFLAGYLAAVVTPGWRVGVISVEDSETGQAARIGFQNGVRFFCGLCRPLGPPYYAYPLYAGLPANASPAEWNVLADFMRNRFVETVFVAPGAGDEALLRYLASQEIQVIAAAPPPPGTESQWVVSIRSDVSKVYLEYLPRLLAGETGIFEPLPVELADANPDILTAGRMRLGEAMLADLQGGWIDTGAGPTPTPTPAP